MSIRRRRTRIVIDETPQTRLTPLGKAVAALIIATPVLVILAIAIYCLRYIFS